MAGNGKAGTFMVVKENEETGVFGKYVIMDT